MAHLLCILVCALASLAICIYIVLEVHMRLHNNVLARHLAEAAKRARRNPHNSHGKMTS